MTGAEAAVRMLDQFGVRSVFEWCGDTSVPLNDALFRLDHGITYVEANESSSRVLGITSVVPLLSRGRYR